MLSLIAFLPMLVPAPTLPARADEERACIAVRSSPLGTVQMAVSLVNGTPQPGFRYAWFAGTRDAVSQAHWDSDGISGLPDTAEVRIIIEAIPRKYRSWAHLELWNDAAPDAREQGPLMEMRHAKPPHVTIEISAGKLRSIAHGGAVTIAAVGEDKVVLWRGSIPAGTLDEPLRLAAAVRPDLDAAIADWRSRCRIVEPSGEIVVT